MADEEATAAARRAADAKTVAAEASRLLLQLRGLMASGNILVPPEFDKELFEWLAKNAGAK